MHRPSNSLLAVILVSCFICAAAQDHPAKIGEWRFAVSGDSRNCGDVVVPAIAASIAKKNAAFYWHLGDLRMISAPDEDYQHAPEHRGQVVTQETYLAEAWDDYIKQQIGAFGKLPVFVGIGNHETVPPKSRADFASRFAQWLNSPPLQAQRQADGAPSDAPTTYFHWVQGGVDFVYLDNATLDQFSPEQVMWLEGVLDRAAPNDAIKAVVVGMHAALPESLASGHSMNDWPAGLESGHQVYADLLAFRAKTHKNVYLLASHSHFFMSGIFDSDYWRSHGGVLPGWIVGTAGAVRYPLPPEAAQAREHLQKKYGYLLGTVHADGSVELKFQEIKRKDVPRATSDRYTPKFANWCFDHNTSFEGPTRGAVAH